MPNIELKNNGVNETGAFSEGAASGRCPVAQQHRPSHNQATTKQPQKRSVWSKDDNRLLFQCYVRSEPERRAYRKRMLALWNTQNTNEKLKEVSEQRLADQVRQTKVKKWLETVEQQEIILRVRGEQQMDNNNIVVPVRERTSDNVQGNGGNIQAEEEPTYTTDISSTERDDSGVFYTSGQNLGSDAVRREREITTTEVV